MPTPRQILATERRNTRLRFSRSRVVEREFQSQLSSVGRGIGNIIKGFLEAGKVTDADGLDEAMSAYSLLLAPWAAAVSARMQAQVSQGDKKAWTQLSRSLGSNLHRLIESAPLGAVLKGLQEEQVALITSLPTEAAQRVHQLTREAIVSGRRAEDIARELARSGQVTVNRAKLIARTEVARTASMLTQTRAMHIGSTGYFWETVGDSDVRPAVNLSPNEKAKFIGSHRALQGKYFEWNNPPVSGQRGERAAPGQIYNCRCWPSPLLPDMYL